MQQAGVFRRFTRRLIGVFLAVAMCLITGSSVVAEEVSKHLVFHRGAVNQALVTGPEGERVAIYGWKDPEIALDGLLLTHARRDVLDGARKLAEGKTRCVGPRAAKDLFEDPMKFWSRFSSKRFHDYAQQSTKLPTAPIPVESLVAQGDLVDFGGLSFRVIETPGFTNDAVSYLAELDGRTVAFTGDLIYGEGKLFDLYSFQEAIKKANIRGYHGYAARLADLVKSLDAIAATKPDLLVPARGPLIRQPLKAITTLRQRVQAVYANYLSTNALHWYFKETRMRFCGQRVLGDGDAVELMPYSRHEKIPDWIYSHSTSRLILSETGAGFLLDCGSSGVIKAINGLIEEGRVKQVEGIFSTHYHDDHTEALEDGAKAFKCPVYAMSEYADILGNPAAYHLPAMTSKPVSKVQTLKEGTRMEWHEYVFTFSFFPGQTYYHGAVLVEKKGERPVFFIGDSFAPSGFDDYCLQNRNLIHDDAGYFLCLKKIRELQPKPWLMNQHIGYVFDFTDEEMDYLGSRYGARRDLLRELFPWDDPNYGIDEQWAVFYPYGSTASVGSSTALEVRLTNHSPKARKFSVQLRMPEGARCADPVKEVELAARASGKVAFTVEMGSPPGLSIFTADVHSEGMEFSKWVEAMVQVTE